MINRKSGFTLIELLVVMAIFGLILAGVADMVANSLNTFKQQGKLVETNIEGQIGLDLLRRDLESAGYGLPWVIPNGITYNEANQAPASNYNEPTIGGTTNPPLPVTGGDAAGPLNGTDYLVVKAANISKNDASRKWNFLPPGSPTPPTGWSDATENMGNTDWVTAIAPGTSGASNPTLAVSGTRFSWKYNNIPASLASGPDTKIIYGIDTDATLGALRAPFNRADFYVKAPAAMPSRCATNTGILYKGVMSQLDGSLTELPLIDCVADMQVTYHLDTNADGVIDTDTNTLIGLDAQTIRAQLKEIHVFVLAQDGQYDKSYTNSTNPILVGDSPTLGRNFDLTAIPNWQNYRWKVYTLVVKFNLR